ncbi:MAG: ABC transporter ATP-binding protein [Deltaproteobacteria bacterium]|nr:ABC transporter ATP-binding protein [Deltaproteobacteria bacterium]
MLKVQDLNVSYGQVQVLRNVSLEIGDGELVALIGANGAGKTTLMKAISGLVPPREGRILFEDRPIQRKEPHHITGLGLIQIPEGRRIFPSLTVLENLEMGSFLKEIRKDRFQVLDQVLDLFPVLGERQKQKAGTLSGGEQQMLAIGRAMMSRPRMLMIDEPSLGLAPLITETIFETIKEINQQGTTILLVEQNVFAGLKMAQRGYVLENGRIVLQGAAQDLLGDSQVKKAYLGM